MQRLSGTKQILAIAGAVLLVAAASGSALAMIDPGLMTTRSEPSARQIQSNAAGQTQQSPLPTPEPTSTPATHGNQVEFRGTVDVIATTGWVISGRTVQVTGDTLVEIGVDVGSLVKVHARRQTDGSLVATKIELLQTGDGDDGKGNENENENENHNGNVNSNDNDDHDDHGNVNSNDDDDHDDDHGNVNANDDHGDDDHGDNSNDDHGGDDHGSNSNDDHGGNH